MVNGAYETVPSDEVTATIALNGSCTLTWDPVTNATAFKVYRATVSNTYGASSLVATIGNVQTYLDTGTAVGVGVFSATPDQIRGVYTNGYTLSRVQDNSFNTRSMGVQISAVANAKAQIRRNRFGGDGLVPANSFQIMQDSAGAASRIEVVDNNFEGTNGTDIYCNRGTGNWHIKNNVFWTSPIAITLPAIGTGAGALIEIISNRFLAQATRAIELSAPGAGTGQTVVIDDNTFLCTGGASEAIRVFSGAVQLARLSVTRNNFSHAGGATVQELGGAHGFGPEGEIGTKLSAGSSVTPSA